MKIYKVEIVKHYQQNNQLIHDVDEIKYFVKKSNCDEYFNKVRDQVMNISIMKKIIHPGRIAQITKSEEVTEN